MNTPGIRLQLLWTLLLLFSPLFVHAQLFQYGDLIITEVMARPNAITQVPDSEYTEIYNPGSNAISLSGFTYSDPTRTLALPNISIAPGEYILLVPRTRVALWDSFRPQVRIIDLSPWPTLLVGGTELTLRGPAGELVYHLAYRDTWYKDAIRAQGGFSLEMIDTDNFCIEEPNWRASQDPSGGTPGRANSVRGSVTDQIGPSLSRVSLQGTNRLRLIFDERLDPASAFMANYQFEPAITSFEISIAEPRFNEITLTLANPLSEGVFYRLQVEGIHDCSGNVIRPEASKARFGLPSPVELGDVVINEILPNPRTGGVKFVEIYNTSAKVLNLQNWRLANLSQGQPANFRSISTDVLLLGPNDYMVFTDDPNILAREYPKGDASKYIRLTLPSYPQASGNVVLIDGGTTVLDLLSYTERFHHRLTREPRGISLERISPRGETNDPENWTSGVQSEGFATPGRRNAQTLREDLMAEHFSIEPKVFAPDSPGTPNFATVRYQFDTPGRIATITLFDVSGRRIKRLAENEGLGTEGFFVWDGTDESGAKVRIGYYVLVFEVYDLDGRFSSFKDTVVVATRF
jgi:hypothetical protein